nr:MAG TPA: hypothetical protein [Bacteriophage sp.]
MNFDYSTCNFITSKISLYFHYFYTKIGEQYNHSP